MFFFKKKPSQIVAIKHMPSTQSATWHVFIRQLGEISFGNLADMGDCEKRAYRFKSICKTLMPVLY